MPRFAAVLTLLVALAGTARAQVQAGVPEVFPSRHELTINTGFQAGFGGRYDNGVSGYKLSVEYAYQFQRIMWFDAMVGNVFGFGTADGVCANTLHGNCYRGGWAVELLAGLKLKWAVRSIPLVIEMPIQVGVDGIYARNCGDNGASVPMFRTGGGVMYFLTRSIGVGGKIDFAGGPAFHGRGSVCGINDSYTDFYGYFDFTFGAEFFL